MRLALYVGDARVSSLRQRSKLVQLPRGVGLVLLQLFLKRLKLSVRRRRHAMRHGRGQARRRCRLRWSA